MHFSKTYTQLLQDLPPDLQENAIQYRELKKLINQVVKELAGMGLQVEVLRTLLQNEQRNRDLEAGESSEETSEEERAKIVYEVDEKSGVIEPRLRVSLAAGESSLQHLLSMSTPLDADHTTCTTLVIPLQSDSAFFTLLSSTLSAISLHLSDIQASFLLTLTTLTSIITSTALPSSRSSPSSFKPYSALSTHPRDLHAPTGALSKSDLYAWREIFGWFVEAEIFASENEYDRGERSVADTEERLSKFVRRVEESEISGKMGKKGREGLKMFLELALLILNIKKFQNATMEASRKILKKHTKRTALPMDDTSLILSSSSRPTFILPKALIQALTSSLLPIIPSLDDYACIICTSIAFKPIRLSCSHLFCVRCLVKMQKRGQGECPMCRAHQAVAKADKGNVDWGLLNFMQDWFPVEAREKMKSSEREVVQEQMKELGLDPDAKCFIM